MPIHTAHGTLLVNGSLMENTAFPGQVHAHLRASQYDESQMKEDDPDRREQRGALLYDC